MVLAHRRTLWPAAVFAIAITTVTYVFSAGVTAPTNRGLRPQQGQAGDESAEALMARTQFDAARTAPTGVVAPGAYGAAFASLTSLPSSGGSWTEVTNKTYNSDDLRYRDPVWSNSTGGAGNVAGRITGLAVDSSAIYAGGANGGVFRSTDGGASWTPLTDDLASLSVGDLKVAPDHAVWLATGEGNTGATSYVGAGVYRNPSGGSSFTRVGGSELESHFINQLRFDGLGKAYAATSRGLYVHSATSTAGAWTRLLAPATGSEVNSPYANIVNDLAIQPGTNGRVILANAAWRSGAAYNGFYISSDAGAHWTKVNPQGAINPREIGNTSFAYSADGKKLYAVVQSTVLINSTQQMGRTVLAGVYASNNGSVTGPWTQIADSRKLASSGSAIKPYQDYNPGVQAWYNQFLIVDPSNANHVYLGLEEVFETRDGGATWNAVGPYWNFTFRCWSFDPAKNTCKKTTHPDQHSVDVANGRLYVGNDGGVHSRPLAGGGWTNHNAHLPTLQYYFVGVGALGGGYAVWGGLQDNGVSLLRPGDATMGSPFGGDGGDVIVDPANACRAVVEYVVLTMAKTTNCGESDGTTKTWVEIGPSDPAPRFIAPFRADAAIAGHWVAGGMNVWTSNKGWDTLAADWKATYTTAGSITALASTNDVIYAGWCGGCNPGSSFGRGMATNTGGSWHELALAGVPNRMISAVAIDSANTNHAYLVLNGFSRRFVEGPGAGVGHVFETTNGGAAWSDVSGNFPDVPANDIVLSGGDLLVATDLGVVASSDNGAHWTRVGGSSLPVTVVMDLTLGPDGNLYAATHGRGIWKVPA